MSKPEINMSSITDIIIDLKRISWPSSPICIELEYVWRTNTEKVQTHHKSFFERTDDQETKKVTKHVPKLK